MDKVGILPTTPDGNKHILTMDYIRAYAETYDDWDQLLPFAMFAYNTSVHEATKFTPFKIVFGKIARTISSFPDSKQLVTYGTYLINIKTIQNKINSS